MAVLTASANGTADGAGAITIAFSAVPNGLAWEGTVSVPGAPAGASWTVDRNGVAISVGSGPGPVGLPTLVEGDVLSLVGTNVGAGVVLTATITGSSVPLNQASGVSPPPIGSVVEISGPVTATISGPVTVTGSVSISGTPSVSISGTPSVSISGTPTVTIASGSVSISGTPTVTIASGSVSISGGPITVQNAAGTVIATGDAVDFLGTASSSVAAGTSLIANIVTTKSYSALAVVVDGGSTGVFAECVSAYDSTASGMVFVAAALDVPNFISRRWHQALVPSANEPGDTISVTAYLNAAIGAGHTAQIWVYGLTSLPVVPRSDGRCRPIGSHIASFIPTANATPILAPAAPLRIFLKAIIPASVFSSTGSTEGHLSATINGTAATIYSQIAGAAGVVASGSTFEPPDGLLLDPGTAVTLTVGAAATNGDAGAILYDLVV